MTYALDPVVLVQAYYFSLKHQQYYRITVASKWLPLLPDGIADLSVPPLPAHLKTQKIHLKSVPEAGDTKVRRRIESYYWGSAIPYVVSQDFGNRVDGVMWVVTGIYGEVESLQFS
jgi:hypothetical protein